MEQSRISLNVDLSTENVGATRRKVVHILRFGGTDWRAASRKEAVDDFVRSMAYCERNRGVVVAFDSSGQPWAGSAVGFRTWEVRRVAPDSSGCAIMAAADGKDLREQIARW